MTGNVALVVQACWANGEAPWFMFCPAPFAPEVAEGWCRSSRKLRVLYAPIEDEL